MIARDLLYKKIAQNILDILESGDGKARGCAITDGVGGLVVEKFSHKLISFESNHYLVILNC